MKKEFYEIINFSVTCFLPTHRRTRHNGTTNGPQIGTSPWEEADLSNEDKSLARTICQALQDKVSIMKRDFLNRGLNFSVDKKEIADNPQHALLLGQLCKRIQSREILNLFQVPSLSPLETKFKPMK